MKDIKSIKQKIDLLLIAQKDVDLQRVASTGGGEWAGPCPFCPEHGEDRFRVQPYAVEGGRWLCRKCTEGKWRDVIDYVMMRDGVDFRHVLDLLDNGHAVPDINASIISAHKVRSKPPTILYDRWQTRCNEFIETSEAALWASSGERALSYLNNRGLSSETIKKYRLGFHEGDLRTKSKDRFDSDLSAWGMNDPETRAVVLPRGIVIPSYLNGVPYSVKIRRNIDMAKDGGPKYLKIKGSRPGIFGATNLIHPNAVFTEGEFDAMLLDQEAGDLIGVATLGSATDNITNLDFALWGPFLLPLRRIYDSYDMDEKGQQGGRALESFSQRIFPIHLPTMEGVKDVTDYFLKGGDIRAWVMSLSTSWIQPETLENILPGDPPLAEPECRRINLNDCWDLPWRVDPTRPCYTCGNSDYRQYPNGSGWVCNTCHPLPSTDKND